MLCMPYTAPSSRGGKSFHVIGGVSLPSEKRHNERHTMKKFIALALVTLGRTSTKEQLIELMCREVKGVYR